MAKKYNHNIVEHDMKVFWQEQAIYKWEEREEDKSFSIDTPPPTISGSLHMGHVFSYCQTDFIARFQRMVGRNVFYPMGFDDNGLATERLVEKENKIKPSLIPRDEFVKLCQKTSKKYIGDFRNLFDRLGLSIDWDLQYNTSSSECVKISQRMFIELYNSGYIYRKDAPVPWDTVDRTAIAQAEIVDIVFQSYMNYIAFHIDDMAEDIIIATTRPELLPACVAVFYHPEDERYSKYAGHYASVPLCNFQVPILPDSHVLPDKGTGLVMCCTFGDELDIKWHNIHDLPVKNIIGKDGVIHNTEQYLIPEVQIDGFAIKEARKIIIDYCQEYSLLIKQVPIEHTVKCAERSENPLEFLPIAQFYIKILDHKQQFLDAANVCQWLPNEMKKKLEQWVDGVKWDWCISRQRYFGVPIPVWYNKNNNDIILPSIEDLPVDPSKDIPKGFNRDEILFETDILDTWATSSLTPQIHCLLYGDREKKIFPFDLRSQSHEIIRTWAFYTIVRSLYHNNSHPWDTLMISGWCVNDKHEKLSKSKSNAQNTPDDLIDTYSADAIRYWAALATTGHDTVLAVDVIQTGKKLVNKIWNCGKFVLNFYVIPDIKMITECIDKWAVNQMIDVAQKAKDDLLQYRYYDAIKGIERFFFDCFCDNYLELVKHRAYNDILGHDSACHALSMIFLNILKLFAVFLPFSTEYIYRHCLHQELSIHMRGSWPQLKKLDNVDNDLGHDCFAIIQQVREIKTKQQISIKKMIPSIMIRTSNKLLQSLESDLLQVCNVQEILWLFEAGSQIIVEEK